MIDSRLPLVVAGLLLLAGCTGSPGTQTTSLTPTPTPIEDGTPTDSPTPTPTSPTYEAYVFDHAGHGSPAIEGGIAYRIEDSLVGRSYVTTVTSRAEATARFNESILDEGARGFVANTSFADSSLVVFQHFPASSVPDYRVESVRREGGTLRVSINDSSRYATADITVETVLLRVPGDAPERVVFTTEEGHTVEASTGVVTVTPDPTQTPEPAVELPYASENASENVADPRDLRLVNRGNHTNGYRLSVTYHEVPDCRDATPPCGMPIREVEVLDRLGKLRSGETRLIEDVVARRGNYTVRVQAMVPTDGSRRTLNASTTWTIDGQAGGILVRITDESVALEAVSPESDS